MSSEDMYMTVNVEELTKARLESALLEIARLNGVITEMQTKKQKLPTDIRLVMTESFLLNIVDRGRLPLKVEVDGEKVTALVRLSRIQLFRNVGYETVLSISILETLLWQGVDKEMDGMRATVTNPDMTISSNPPSYTGIIEYKGAPGEEPLLRCQEGEKTIYRSFAGNHETVLHIREES